MEDLKISVTTEQESKEAKNLLLKLRCAYWAIEQAETPSDEFIAGRGKQVTLQELRNMAGFLKQPITETEYLTQGENGARLNESIEQLRATAKTETLNDKVASAEVMRQELKGIDATLAKRQSQYGSFEDVAFVTENIMATLAKVRPKGLSDLPHPHRMALYMIASKMARIVNGDINHTDSWHDIGGYAKLIEDIIQGEAL